jgi:hypothetical protein
MNIFGFSLSPTDIWLLGACGTLIVLWIGFHLSNTLNQRNAFRSAAATFRSKVLSELEGLYPVTQHWDMNVFPRFYQSIIKIESAAAEFRFFITRKGLFDLAVKEYCDYCKQISWDKCAGWSMYPTMRKPGEISPRDKFAQYVQKLLSFTEEK